MSFKEPDSKPQMVRQIKQWVFELQLFNLSLHNYVCNYVWYVLECICLGVQWREFHLCCMWSLTTGTAAMFMGTHLASCKRGATYRACMQSLTTSTAAALGLTKGTSPIDCTSSCLSTPCFFVWLCLFAICRGADWSGSRPSTAIMEISL